MKTLSLFVFTLLVSGSTWALSPNSVYHVDSSWTTQEDKAVNFSSLEGKVRIVSMIFTRCPSACPMIVGDIKMILSKLPEKMRSQVAVDLFSFDHERDNPEALRAFRKKMKIENPSWTVYTSDKATVAELAAVLGVQYKPLEGGAFVHSNNIILVNKEGEMLKTIEGYDVSADDFIALLKKELGKK